MTNETEDYVPFSQRTGLEPVPPQLKLGEVSEDLRRLLYYYISLEIDRETTTPHYSVIFRAAWKRVAQDTHVRFFKNEPDTFNTDPAKYEQQIKSFIETANIGSLFDFVEFLVRHPNSSLELKTDLAGVFVEARAAYRIHDNKQIIAIGSEEQAAAFQRAIIDVEMNNAAGAKRHLIDAGVALRNGEWADSIRESIHAVESIAVNLAPGSNTLGTALKAIDKRGHLHGRLKQAFEQLYAYTNAENGVRHANVFDGAETQVDEADALFMLGACASFVSYLLARSNTA